MKLPKLSKLRDILYWSFAHRELKPTDEAIDWYFAWFQLLLRKLCFRATKSNCICPNCKLLRDLASPQPESWTGLLDENNKIE